MKRRDFLRKTGKAGAIIIASGSLLEVFADPRLHNYLVLDIDGNPRNYELKGAPICEVPPGEETYKYCSGICDYLDVSGKPALIAFMHYLCSPCKFNLPIINKIHDKYKEKLQVVGVNLIDKIETKEECIRETKKVLKDHKVKFPNLTMLTGHMGGVIGDVVDEMGFKGRVALPQYFLVDENRYVVYQARKLYEKEVEKSLINKIEKLLKENDDSSKEGKIKKVIKSDG